jgi:plasmid stability protein
MAQLVVKDIDPLLIEKLKSRSQQHSRSLNEELIAILKQAINALRG